MIPEYLIDEKGKRPDGATEDPRWKSFSKICGMNGKQHVSAEGWAFKPGILNGGDSATHEPDDNSLEKAPQLIYKVTLNGTASTSSTTASGTLSPNLQGMYALLVPANGSTSYSGEGMINLNIPALCFHVPNYLDEGQYYFCTPYHASKHEFKMEENATVYVDVRVKTIGKRDKLSLGLTATSTYGGVNFGYEESRSESYATLRKEFVRVKRESWQCVLA